MSSIAGLRFDSREFPLRWRCTMRVAFHCRPLRLALALLAACAIEACHGPSPFEVSGAPSRSFSINVGEQITISIGGVGPSYADPPAITGSALAYLNMTNPPTTVVNPGGAVQLYHFKGVANGQAIILFQGPNVVVDTVLVR